MYIHSPHCDNPDNIVATARLSIPSPQLVTMHSSANAFAKSFVVSVFPDLRKKLISINFD